MSLQEKVKKLAYELYEKNGRREGGDLLDWLAAEQIMQFHQKIISGMGADGVGLLEYKPLSVASGKPAQIKQSPPRRPSGGGRPAVAERSL